MLKKRLVAPSRFKASPPEPEALETAPNAAKGVFEFSVMVRYTARIKAPDGKTARQRLYAMFVWLHDGIGKWLVPMPPDPWLADHWVTFQLGDNDRLEDSTL